MTRSAWLVLAVMAAGSPASAGPASVASHQPLGEALLQAAGGKELLFALDAKGQLVARTIDGSASTVLLAGPYATAYHDAARDLIWLRRDSGFDVLDLRATGPAVAKTVIAAPAKVAANLDDPIVEPPRWDMTGFLAIQVNTPCQQGAGLAFDLSKDGACTTTGSEALKVVAKDWFAAQAHRPAREVPAGFTRAIKKRHRVPARVGKCHHKRAALCGTGLDFGVLPYELVIVSADHDLCPAVQCRLYDATTKRYKSVPGLPAGDARTCGPFLFDESGTSYLVGDQVCDPAQHCTSVGKQAIGWLGADRVLDAS